MALVVKNLLANAGDLDTGSIPGLGRSPGGGHGNLLQYTCLENPMNGGAWQATVHLVTKSQTWQSSLACMHMPHFEEKKQPGFGKWVLCDLSWISVAPHSTAARGSMLSEKGLEPYLDLELSPASSYLCPPHPPASHYNTLRLAFPIVSGKWLGVVFE